MQSENLLPENRPKMSRTSSVFKQSDLTRAVKGVLAAGLEVVQTKIARDGSIVMVHKAAQVPDDADAALDAWQAKRHGSHSA
jgi:hypothetical protein